MEKLINTQSELDALDVNFAGDIIIEGKIERINKYYPNAWIYVRGNAQISNVYGNAQISNVYGNAQIRYVDGNAQIRYVDGNAQIRYVDGNAQISNVYGNAQISNVYGNAQISNVYGNAQISNVYGNAQIRYVDGNAQISNVYGNAAVLFVDGKAKVHCAGKNIVSYYNDKNVQLDLSKETTIVILDRFKADWDSYKRVYPFEIKDDKAILYKAVRKTKDGKFVADYDPKFEYKIGETKTEKCDQSTDKSCSYGIHISHKMWALRFGANWDNMALLEFEVPIDKIVVAADCDGKIRSSEVFCVREVPKEEYYL
jgi:hypothetical protein